MLDWINKNYRKHILTIEDPVEFVFDDDKSLINQCEVGECVKDFATAMKHAVREEPDVILVGEKRDAESFEMALHAAETGYLVLAQYMLYLQQRRSDVSLTCFHKPCTVPSAAAAGEQQPQGSSALPQLRQQTGDADVARGRVVLSVRPRVRQRMW